jgi:hypothetical protein
LSKNAVKIEARYPVKNKAVSEALLASKIEKLLFSPISFVWVAEALSGIMRDGHKNDTCVLPLLRQMLCSETEIQYPEPKIFHITLNNVSATATVHFLNRKFFSVRLRIGLF